MEPDAFCDLGPRQGAASTLPDHMGPGLRVVFVGINPSLYSVARGHYYARPTNRFWKAFSRSVLSAPVREALGRRLLGPEDDGRLLAFGFGFTDVVKLPSRRASDLSSRAFQAWAPRLRHRLLGDQPAVACFHGLAAWRGFARYGGGWRWRQWRYGLQRARLGETRLFVVPNPSAANAAVRLEELVRWYNRLAGILGFGG